MSFLVKPAGPLEIVWAPAKEKAGWGLKNSHFQRKKNCRSPPSVSTLPGPFLNATLRFNVLVLSLCVVHIDAYQEAGERILRQYQLTSPRYFPQKNVYAEISALGVLG